MPRIPRSIVDEMVAHSREDLPNEACGMVHARDGVPTQVHRVKNDAASPYRYEMNPLQMMRLERGREDDGESLFAIYHSHVGSKAYPLADGRAHGVLSARGDGPGSDVPRHLLHPRLTGA